MKYIHTFFSTIAVAVPGRFLAIVNKVKAHKNDQHVIYIATLRNPHRFEEKNSRKFFKYVP